MSSTACDDGRLATAQYNLPLHIASVFILLAASWASVAFPYATALFAGSPRAIRISRALTFALRYFGGGIILATAFVHLLYDAFSTMSSPCIGDLSFGPTSPAIAMAAVYIMMLLDLVILRPIRRRVRLAMQDDQGASRDSSSALKNAEGSLSKWSVLALEAGIVFHSVIIGVNLGTSAGSDWIVILIALTFHQFCEGLSLTSRIIILPAGIATRTWRFVMHAFFAFSTSIGIAIGIAVRSRFNGDDRTTLLAIGVLESFAAGILIYSALTQVIVQDFQLDEQTIAGSNMRCILAFSLFTLGAFVMVSRANRLRGLIRLLTPPANPDAVTDWILDMTGARARARRQALRNNGVERQPGLWIARLEPVRVDDARVRPQLRHVLVLLVLDWLLCTLRTMQGHTPLGQTSFCDQVGRPVDC